MIEPLLWEEFNSYYKFMYTDENNKKNKNDLPLSPFHFSYSFSTLFRMRGGGGGWTKKLPYQCFRCNFYKRRN